jgi:hypothetical protein
MLRHAGGHRLPLAAPVRDMRASQDEMVTGQGWGEEDPWCRGSQATHLQ